MSYVKTRSPITMDKTMQSMILSSRIFTTIHDPGSSTRQMRVSYTRLSTYLCRGKPMRPESNPEKRKKRRADIKVIQDHYKGKINKAICTKETEVPRNRIHYNNERPISFGKFLATLQSGTTTSYWIRCIRSNYYSRRSRYTTLPSLRMNRRYNTTYIRTELSNLTALTTVWHQKHPIYYKMHPIANQVGCTPGSGGGQHQIVVPRDHWDIFT